MQTATNGFDLTTQNDSSILSERSVRIAGDHGYRIDGDTAILNADLAVLGEEEMSRSWALQLWACDQPHVSGPILGVKIAEAPIQLPNSAIPQPLRLSAEAFAQLPVAHREFAMVLAVASGHSGHFEELHDFANYPSRQLFLMPFLSGAAGYSIEGAEVVLWADRVENPRPVDNLSGSLALELWATSRPYGGDPIEGVLLARADLGQIEGQSWLGSIEHRVELSHPPDGHWRLLLALREWTAAGDVTRDLRTFDVPFRTGTEEYPEVPWAPAHEDIAFAAYYRYLARGERPGSAFDDWIEAERELSSRGP